MATHPDTSKENATEAVTLAEKANRLGDGKEPGVFRTLAAGYAGCGRFREADDAAQRALILSRNPGLTQVLEQEMTQYQAGAAHLASLEGERSGQR